VHPRVGASWEGFIIEQLRALLKAEPDECYFWRTEHGAELDMLFIRRGRRWGFEIKRTTAPTITPSMRVALVDLALDALHVIHAGPASFSLAPKVDAISWTDLNRITRRR
jgi:predicted AAA+ superfamily ATPase